MTINGINGHYTNGHHQNPPLLTRADELDELLAQVKDLIIPFVQAADDSAFEKATGNIPQQADGVPGRNVLVDYQKPAAVVAKLKFSLPEEGAGKDGLLEMIEKVLQCSVNTWDQGFLDKLYASNTPVGVVSDLILSILNTNLHVFQVSPALSVIEKTTARTLAKYYGFDGPFSGGITCQGGSSSNLTSLVVARNTLYPECKTKGNSTYDFVVFTSAHGHYSVEKSAMICGLGSSAVVPVPVDEEGCMRVDDLSRLVSKAKAEGRTPLYVNATAGTTVRGSFEAFEEISAVCKANHMWMHIDGSWGGPAIFSKQHRHKLRGSHLADSLTVNPHKMLAVPTTCSFLLCHDTNTLRNANSTSAGYLFHGAEDGEAWDLADLTLQCGRRGDSLKLALAWLYYGSNGFERQIDHAFDMASRLFGLVEQNGQFLMLGTNPPPCLQVCFYHAPGGVVSDDKGVNTARTQKIVERLIGRGFMVDYAPGDKGSFIRVVVNVQTLESTVDGLAKALDELAR